MTLWRESAPLVLASKSAARRSILHQAGFAVECLPADLDERDLEQQSGLSDPAGIALLLARAKAEAVSKHRPDAVVIGADQTLALGQKRLSKPPTRAAALAQLQQLQGRRHELHAAVAVCRNGRVMFQHVAAAVLTMRPLDDRFLAAYLDAAGSAVTGSVGAYQLEGLGVHLFEAIDGDYFTILGLPLLPLLTFFRSQGWVWQ